MAKDSNKNPNTQLQWKKSESLFFHDAMFRSFHQGLCFAASLTWIKFLTSVIQNIAFCQTLRVNILSVALAKTITHFTTNDSQREGCIHNEAGC